jgi:cell division protein FtsA
VTGLSEVVSNAIHATGVGLLLYGSQAGSRRALIGGPGGDAFLDRVKSWFRGEF